MSIEKVVGHNGISYIHKCVRQDETSECVHRFVSRTPVLLSYGWAIDINGHTVLIDHCLYCGVKLEELKPAMTVEDYRQLVLGWTEKVAGWAEEVQGWTDSLGVKLEELPDDKIEVSRKDLEDLAWEVESICNSAMTTKRGRTKLRELIDRLFWDKVHD